MTPKRALHLLVLITVATVPGLGQSADSTRIGDFTLTHRIPTLDVLDQGRTGTCWSFATVSFLESEAARTAGRLVDLSEMHLVRHTILMKARRYLEARGEANFGQGGLSHDVIAVARRHGLLPAEAYAGCRNPRGRHDHSEMFRLLKGALDGLAKSRRARKPSPYLDDAILGIVDAYLGPCPDEVRLDGKEVSPKDFTTEVLDFELDGYVEVMSYGIAPFHSRAKLPVADNWMHFDEYWNVPVDEFMRAMDHALESGYGVAVDIDVSEKGFSRNGGVARLPEELEKPGAVTQEVRDEMFRTEKTTDDHLMHVVGIAEGPDGGRWYYTKNSWGKGAGVFGGYVFISEPYMRAKTLAYMVHEGGLPKDVRAKMKEHGRSR